MISDPVCLRASVAAILWFFFWRNKYLNLVCLLNLCIHIKVFLVRSKKFQIAPLRRQVVKKSSSSWYFKHDVRKAQDTVFLLQRFHYSIYFFNFCFTGSLQIHGTRPLKSISSRLHTLSSRWIFHTSYRPKEEYEYRCHSVVKMSPTLLLYCHEDATYILNGSRLRRRAVCYLSIALRNILRFYASAPH